MRPYAVVTFLNEDGKEGESASEVASSWLSENLQECWWPNLKNVGPHILKRTIPDPADKKWQLHDVKFLGFHDNISNARQKADGLSSGDEISDSPQIERRSNLATIHEETMNRRVGKGKRKGSLLVEEKKEAYAAR